MPVVYSFVGIQSCPRVGWTRVPGRVVSRFCRILAGRVGLGQHFVFVSFLLIILLVPESIWIFEYYIRIDWFSTIFNI